MPVAGPALGGACLSVQLAGVSLRFIPAGEFNIKCSKYVMVYIRNFEQNDFDSVKDIYQQGIDTGNATFETQAKEWDEWNNSMLQVCRLVAVENDRVVGWAALSPVSSRCVYAGVAEVSLYVTGEAHGKGVGHALISALVEESEKEGFWTLQAVIFPENESSIALHQKNGFRILGLREKLGKMGEKWRDVVLLERRSKVVGVEST
jgi:L-amino acid N-acyltransferase YncA